MVDTTLKRSRGYAPDDRDIEREHVPLWERNQTADKYSEEYAHIMERKMKRINDAMKKKDIEGRYFQGNDAILKDRLARKPDQTWLPLDVLPEKLAYEQLGEIHEPLQTKWRCPDCGTLHLKRIPEFWDTRTNSIRAGCSFCKCDNHWLNRLNFKRL